ncbi:MAG: hypothetical protein B7Y80_14905 [Hyphomicrobium sp. 32-62-53]|jgi:hypothetical protein|nr:MAG: hypothetical protein B7Z29_15560 [Hyphomicrobium sp. 12-62-95]OYX98617.1 MAG: hypothetical protein B7Y80_14905 [Hyphomicrobium sp. 32-62-53]
MRTTLDIDEDILAAAKELARAEGKTAGQVLSDLARRALTTPVGHPPGLAERQIDYDDTDELFPCFPDRGGVIITTELVRKIQDEIDDEDAKRAACIARGEQPD